MSKLLKCPFCGGEARVRDCTREEQTTIVNGEMYKMCGCEHYCAEMFGYTEEEAIEKWNTRTPMDNIVEKLEEKTEFLKDCTKYGNESAEQQEKSYSTMMMYEVADLVDDLIDIVKHEINKEN